MYIYIIHMYAYICNVGIETFLWVYIQLGVEKLEESTPETKNMLFFLSS